MTRIGPRICLKVHLCPNLTQKVQKEVSQIANRNFSLVILLGGLSVNLNHLKMDLSVGWTYIVVKMLHCVQEMHQLQTLNVHKQQKLL